MFAIHYRILKIHKIVWLSRLKMNRIAVYKKNTFNIYIILILTISFHVLLEKFNNLLLFSLNDEFKINY